GSHRLDELAELFGIEIGEVRCGDEARPFLAFLELDGGPLDDRIRPEDLSVAANWEVERAGRARNGLELVPGLNECDAREGRVLAELGHGLLDDLALELGDDLAEEVVRHRALWAGPLEPHEDRGGLRLADPDWEEAILVDCLEEHDRLLADRLEAHAVESHLAHPTLRIVVRALRYSSGPRAISSVG